MVVGIRANFSTNGEAQRKIGGWRNGVQCFDAKCVDAKCVGAKC